jgi:hypothetical protein
MNRREWELLDKQLWGIHPHPPVSGAVLSFGFIAMFLSGILLGGWLFAHKSNQMQVTSAEQMIALFQTNGLPPAAQ